MALASFGGAIVLSDYFQKSFRQTMEVSSDFGVSTSRTLVIATRHPGGGETYIQVCPNPIIQVVSVQEMEALANLPNVQIEKTDLKVTGIPRTYSADEIFGPGTYYLIDAILKNDIPQGGIIADAVQGYRATNRELDYELLLRERVSR